MQGRAGQTYLTSSVIAQHASPLHVQCPPPPLLQMGVLVPGGDRTAVKRTADFFLTQFTERLEAQVGRARALWWLLGSFGWA